MPPKPFYLRHPRFFWSAAGLLFAAVLICIGFYLHGTAANTQDAGTAATGPIQIIGSELLGPDTIKVTFDRKLAGFSATDLAVTKAMGSWANLDPQLNIDIAVKSVETGEDNQHRTTATFRIAEALNPDGTFPRKERVVPGKAPYLTAKYYSGIKAKDIEQAENLLTWQMENGGWFKNMAEQFRKPWDGKTLRSEWRTKGGGDIATIDNDATTNELLFLAVMYGETGDPRYKDSVLKAIDLLLRMQYPSGGWPQVYPARGNYSDNVTFNDNAMIRVMNVLKLASERKYPFDNDIVNDALITKIRHELDLGVDYILKSQIKVDGKLTAWCAQNDPVTYEPRQARAYEFPSISGSESVGIVQYLMALPNSSEEVKRAIQGALDWFEEVRVKETRFVPADPKNVYFVHDPSSSIWYRFYEIGTNLPIFAGRDSVIKHNLLDIEKERRDGYAWAGTWPAKLLQTAKTTGYFENRVYIRVIGTNSKDAQGQTLEQGRLNAVTPPAGTGK